MEAKRLGMLHQMLPKTAVIAVLAGTNNPSVDRELKEDSDAADALGRQLDVLKVASAADIETAFATLVQRGDAQ